MQKFLATVLTGLLCAAGNLEAAEIFRWTDDEGVVHYSDTAPEPGASPITGVSTIVVAAANAPDYEPGENEYSILSQAERINARFEKLRAEREARDERERDRYVARSESGAAARRYHDGYRRSYYYAPFRPHRPVFPERPGLRASQLATLERLGLDHRKRPHSINSSAHLKRIQAGAALLETPNAK